MKEDTKVEYAEVDVEDIMKFYIDAYNLKIIGYEYFIDQNKNKVIIRIMHRGKGRNE